MTPAAIATSMPGGRDTGAMGAVAIRAYFAAVASATAAGSGKVKTGNARCESSRRIEEDAPPTRTATTGLTATLASSAINSSTTLGSARAVSVNTTSTASTSPAFTTSCTASWIWLGIAAAPRSMGFLADGAVGTSARNRCSVAGSSETTSRPTLSAVSAARIFGPPEFPITATRFPCGSG